MSSLTPTKLSQVTVQPDVLEVIGDVEQGLIEQEDVWVSCYESEKPSVHGKVRVSISDEARDQCAFKGREGVECQKIEDVSMNISQYCDNSNTRLVSVCRTLSISTVQGFISKTASSVSLATRSLFLHCLQPKHPPNWTTELPV